MTDSLGTLLSSSFSYFKTKLVPIAIGALVFGALMYGCQMYFQVSAADSMPADSPFGNMEQLEELAERAQQGDQAALQELMNEAAKFEGMDSEEAMQAMAGDMMKGMLPAFGMFFVLSMLISIVSSAYYLLLAIDPTATGQSAAGRMPKYILPLLGLWLWTFIRSFAWIPFIGFIFAMALGPRFITAPVLLMRQNMGVMQSAAKSWEATRGYWAKIFGNLIAVSIIVAVIMMVIGYVLTMVAQTASVIMVVPMIIGSMATAYVLIFCVKLADTILANPKQS